MGVEVSYKKIGKIGGIVSTNRGRYAIVGNEGWSYNVAFKPYYNIYHSDKLILNSHFVSGYKGSNYAGIKGKTHYTPEMLKVIRELDSSFALDKKHKPISKNCKIIIKYFATAKRL